MTQTVVITNSDCCSDSWYVHKSPWYKLYNWHGIQQWQWVKWQLLAWHHGITTVCWSHCRHRLIMTRITWEPKPWMSPLLNKLWWLSYFVPVKETYTLFKFTKPKVCSQYYVYCVGNWACL